MKTCIWVNLLLVFGLFNSCITVKMDEPTKRGFTSITKSGIIPSDTLKIVSDYVVMDRDTLRIDKDTIFVKTNRFVKQLSTGIKIPNETTIEFVGSTELQDAVSGNKEIPANAGIGIRLTKTYDFPTSWMNICRLESNLSIGIASTVDSIIAVKNSNNETLNLDVFGNSILMPSNSGQSVYVDFRAFMKPAWNLVLLQNYGIQGAITASNRKWTLNSISQNISILSIKGGVFSELVPAKDINDFSASVGVDLSSRIIFGNIGHTYADDFRNSIIGTKTRFFFGIEPNFTIRLKDLKAVASFPLLYSKNNEIPGLTKGQFVTMIKFTGGVPLSLEMFKKK